MDKISRLKKKESRLVAKGSKAVDEGREKKATRLLGRAAKTESRMIKAEGKWDTINLTKMGRANTVKEGVASTKKWHKDNPDYKYKKKKT